MASSNGTRPTHASGAISSDGNAAERQRPLRTARGTPKRGYGVSATATTASPAPLAPTIATSPIAPSPPLEPSRQGALPALHPPRFGRRALVVVAQQVQHAVNEQSVELRRQRGRAFRRLPPRRVDGDDDVAQQPRWRAARPLGLREREHVGGPVLPPPLTVQPAHDGV